MSIQLVWGLQNLRQNLKSSQREAFAELEYEIVDLLHRQRLYPKDTNLHDRLQSLLQQCDDFAYSSIGVHLEDLCKGMPHIYVKESEKLKNSTHWALGLRDQDSRLPKVEITLLTKYVPISYCYQKNAREEDYPLVTLIVDTTQIKEIYEANVQVYIEKYGTISPRHLTFLPGQIRRYQFLPSITKENLKYINEKCAAHICVEIQYLYPQDKLYKDSCPVYLLPYNAALLWMRSWDGSWVNYIEYLAGWVTPRVPEIQQLYGKAKKYHPEREFHGYDYVGTKEKRKKEIRKIVQAFFDVLHKEVDLCYGTSSIFIPSAAEEDPSHVIQWVRLPENTLTTGGFANCIDASVLFASLLEFANLQPLLLFLPNHALVGWRVMKDDRECEFLETTLIGEGDFDRALQRGQKLYTNAVDCGFLENPRFVIGEYALLVDIKQCRAQDILALS